MISKSMVGFEKQVEAAAINVATATKPGAHTVRVVFEGKNTPQSGQIDAGNGKNLVDCLPYAQTSIDFSPGIINNTGNLTDIALQGDQCFFELITSSGEKIYTKNGEFHFNHDGELVSVNGYKVSNDGSAPIKKGAGGGDVFVDRAGNIQQNGTNIGKMGVFKVKDLAKLIPAKGGYVIEKGAPAAQQAEKYEVFQGALEYSNASAIMQMTNMTKASQAYALGSHLLRQQSELTEKYNQWITSA